MEARRVGRRLVEPRLGGDARHEPVGADELVDPQVRDPGLDRAEREAEDSEHEAEVAHAVDDERLDAGVGLPALLVLEAYEEVAREADPFPADEHEEEVTGEDEDEHHAGEQVEVREVARESSGVLARHVAARVDVDKRAHAEDDEAEDPREPVEDEPERDVEATGRDPGHVRVDAAARHRRSVPGEGAVLLEGLHADQRVTNLLDERFLHLLG